MRDVDRETFNPLKKSALETAIKDATGLDIFEPLGDIRNLPGYAAARKYFNRMTMGVGGTAFNKLWNTLKANDHWLTDRYQETGPFGLFYHVVNKF